MTKYVVGVKSEDGRVSSLTVDTDDPISVREFEALRPEQIVCVMEQDAMYSEDVWKGF